jgi:hypothetical protein
MLKSIGFTTKGPVWVFRRPQSADADSAPVEATRLFKPTVNPHSFIIEKQKIK